MTPKGKAKELFLKFRQIPPSSPYTGVDDGEAKQCALIAVDEMLDNNEQCLSRYRTNYDRICIKEFWLVVKEEIENL